MFKSKTLMFSYLLVTLGVLEVNLHLMQEALGPYSGTTNSNYDDTLWPKQSD